MQTYENEHRPNGSVTLGPELHIAKTTIVEPRTSTLVPAFLDGTFTHGELPPEEIVVNGRSSIAQRGGDLNAHANAELARNLYQGDLTVGDARFTNFAQVPIAVDEGEVGRLLFVKGEHLQGQDLENAFTMDQITFSGENDTAWVHRTPDGRAHGVLMVLGKQEQWVPESDELLPSAPDAYGSFRDDLQRRLEPIPHPHEHPGLHPLRIGETVSTLSLAHDMIGYINPAFTATASSHFRIANGHHVNAPWLYGNDKWPIRTETTTSQAELQKPAAELPPKAIIVTFATVTNPYARTG